MHFLTYLANKQKKGACYIETKNLDGETNLKPKSAKKELQSLYDESSNVKFQFLRCIFKVQHTID